MASAVGGLASSASEALGADVVAGSSVPDAVRSAMALVVCDDGTQRTYRTGFVAASNGFESYVVAKGGAGCHAPVVTLLTEPTHRYAAQLLPSLTTGVIAIDSLVLAIDRPLATPAPLVQRPFVKGESDLLVGFPIVAGDASAPVALTAARGTVSFVGAKTNDLLGSDGGFVDSATTMASAVVVDPDVKGVVGWVDAYKALLVFGQPPTTEYYYHTAAAITGLLQTRGVTAGVQHLSGDAATAARVAASLRGHTFAAFRGGREGRPALVLGSTPTATLYVALDGAGSGDDVIAVRDRSGVLRMTPATAVARDADTGMRFLSTPRIDVAAPDFANPPGAGGAVAFAFTPANGRCAWSAPAPAPDGCRFAVGVGRVTGPHGFPPGVLDVAGLPLYAPEGSAIGLPVVDPQTLAVVGITANSGLVPMALIARAAAAHGLGLTIPLRS